MPAVTLPKSPFPGRGVGGLPLPRTLHAALQGALQRWGAWSALTGEPSCLGHGVTHRGQGGLCHNKGHPLGTLKPQLQVKGSTCDGQGSGGRGGSWEEVALNWPSSRGEARDSTGGVWVWPGKPGLVFLLLLWSCMILAVASSPDPKFLHQ